MRPSMVALVARREILSRVRERSFLISTFLTFGILAAIVVLPQLFGAGGRDEVDVAAAGPGGAEVVRAAAPAGDALDVELRLRPADGDGAARALVDSGEAELAVLAGGERIVRGPDAPDEAVAALQAAAADLRAAAALQEAGLSADAARAALRPPPLPVEELGGDDDTGEGIAAIALLLLYGQLITYGYWVAAGVVEEKASRVVELLLAAVRPRELLAGKVLGIGALALTQLLLVSGLALGLALATDQLQLEDGAVRALVITLAWFLLGYVFYACAFAVAGALVPRQEELQNVTTPMLLLLIGTFLLAFQVLEDPGSALARVLSFAPPSAPMIMPVRLIAGDVGVLEVLGSVLAVLAGIAGLVVLAGRVYGRAVLQTGSRVKLAGVLRGG